MKRVALSGVVFLLIAGAAVYSRQAPPGGVAPATDGELTIAVGEKNPWTGLKLNNAADQFQFAVVTDRTGGHRPKVFSRAMTQINLLQPEFVVSVGDLIEGYTVNQDRINADWDEVNGYIKTLEMPFFYVPGNHDLANKTLVADWGGRYGRSYYHFLYKGVLFLCMNSEDPPSRISAEQLAHFQKVLDENKSARWTLLFLHKPLWAAPDLDKNGWAGVEAALAGRKYTAFCGHTHHYKKVVRNGMNHYSLATTGGGSRMRGPEFGEFDHVGWVTMKQDGPRMVNLNLDGVLPDDLTLPESDEKGREVKGRMATEKFVGTVTLKGQPVATATVRFHRKGLIAGKFDFLSEGRTDADGRFEASTYAGFDGIPIGEYRVTVSKAGEPDAEGKATNALPAKYAKAATTPLTVTIRQGVDNRVTFELEE